MGVVVKSGTCHSYACRVVSSFVLDGSQKVSDPAQPVTSDPSHPVTSDHSQPVTSTSTSTLWTMDRLRNYIAFIKSLNPTMTPEANQ